MQRFFGTMDSVQMLISVQTKMDTITTMCSDLHPGWGKRPQTFSGKIVPSTKYDPPGSVRMTTEFKYFPFRVIAERMIASINGVPFEHKAFSAPTIKIVAGSKGQFYTVTTDNGRTTCTCPGFQFRKNCKHVGG